MRTLIIHPTDSTTDFLSVIYQDVLGLDNYTLMRDFESGVIDNEILDQFDRIIILGHGCPEGLLNMNDIGLLIDDTNADTLRNKELIGIWCDADIFFQTNELKGIYTGMIISEKIEATHCLPQFHITSKQIKDSNERFAIAMKNLIKKYCFDQVNESVSYSFQDDINYFYPPVNEVMKYNNNRIFLTK